MVPYFYNLQIFEANNELIAMTPISSEDYEAIKKHVDWYGDEDSPMGLNMAIFAYLFAKDKIKLDPKKFYKFKINKDESFL